MKFPSSVYTLSHFPSFGNNYSVKTESKFIGMYKKRKNSWYNIPNIKDKKEFFHMNILPQILNVCSKNCMISNISLHFQKELYSLLDKFLYHPVNFLPSIMMSLQKMMNDVILKFLSFCFQAIDHDFKDSPERKKKFFINKSNVERSLFTIFGELSFSRTLYQNKQTGEYYFYLDDLLQLESYKYYDPLVQALILRDSSFSNPNHSTYHSSLDSFHLESLYSNTLMPIPKSTLYYYKKNIKILKMDYKEIPTDHHTLYVMVDEKWIHEQDKSRPNEKKWIMSKCFVTFTGITRKGKRSRLVGRHIFITSSDHPWKDFMDEIPRIYNFENLNTINLLSDAGSWILSGASELKLYTNNKITINTCEFHVKQKINRSTSDRDLRIKIANMIYEQEDKKGFIKEMDKLIDSKTKDARKQKVTEYKNYILKHWKGIIHMKYSLCKSSMEAHIEHCIASMFSSVPKAFSRNNIETYLKLQEMILNDVNIFCYYLDTFQSFDESTYSNEKEVTFSLFEKTTSNIPNLSTSNSKSFTIHSIAYPSF